jgi:hypothetical protein
MHRGGHRKTSCLDGLADRVEVRLKMTFGRPMIGCFGWGVYDIPNLLKRLALGDKASAAAFGGVIKTPEWMIGAWARHLLPSH